MDNMTFTRHNCVDLGAVNRTLTEPHDLFAVLADPGAFACHTARFPSGPTSILIEVPKRSETLIEEEFDGERWDGLS